MGSGWEKGKRRSTGTPSLSRRVPTQMTSSTFAFALILAPSLPAAALPASGAVDLVPMSHGAVFAQQDSATVHAAARRAQENFEAFREGNLIPQTRPRGAGGGCDEVVGRFCLTSSGMDDEAEFPPPPEEPVGIGLARSELLRDLAGFHEQIPGDAWILGQRVYYLLERRAFREAQALAEGCVLAETWWCDALLGYALHEAGRWVEAEAAFALAIDAMPAEVRREWLHPGALLDRDGRNWFDGLPGDEQARVRGLLRLLSDPLYFVDGNDRWTAHLSRLVLLRLLEDSANPFSLQWGQDLEEILLRFGWAQRWERARGQAMPRGLQDTRSMVGILDPAWRDFVPPGQILSEFPRVQDGEWWIGEGRPRTGHLAAYAPRFRMLESQIARFRRDDELLVVVAWDVPEEAPRRVTARTGADDDPFRSRFPTAEESAPPPGASLPTDLKGGLFLIPLGEEGSVHAPVVESAGTSGVLTARVPNRDQVASYETWSEYEGRAWRVRRGLPELPLADGSLQLSDPILLRDEEELPESLDEALDRVLPSVRVQPGETFVVAWEVYGVQEGRPAQVSIGIERSEQSLLRRLGEFFRVLEPPAPVVIRWEEGDPEEPGTVFRSIYLTLPELDDGNYDLFLEVGVAGEPPAVARRRIRVRPPN